MDFNVFFNMLFSPGMFPKDFGCVDFDRNCDKTGDTQNFVCKMNVERNQIGEIEEIVLTRKATLQFF